jgi:hypothetical protein
MNEGSYHLMQAKAQLGAVAVELEQLTVFVDAPPAPKGPRLTADRVKAITGLSGDELRVIAAMSGGVRRLSRSPLGSCPGAAVGSACGQPHSSSIAPSRGDARRAQFGKLVGGLTSEAAE